MAKAAGLTKEDALKRVEEIRQEFRTHGISNNPTKKVFEKKTRKLILQESDNEEENRNVSKRTKTS